MSFELIVLLKTHTLHLFKVQALCYLFHQSKISLFTP